MISQPRPRLRHLLPIVLPLAGCAATGGDYPSLAPRPVEQGAAAPAAAEPPAAPPANPALPAETAAILAAADKGHAAFLAQLGSARAAIEAARGKEAGSEAWVAAQVALSTLDAARSPVLAALADLDALRIGMLQEGRSSDADALDEAARTIEAREAEERDALGRLGAALPELAVAGG